MKQLSPVIRVLREREMAKLAPACAEACPTVPFQRNGTGETVRQMGQCVFTQREIDQKPDVSNQQEGCGHGKWLH